MAEGNYNVLLKSVIITKTTDATGNFTTSLDASKKVVMARAIRESPYYASYYFCLTGTAANGNTAITCVLTANGNLTLLANTDVKVEVLYYE